MPIEDVTPEEFERLTGGRGSVYIHFGAPRRVEAEQQWSAPYQGFRWPIDPRYPQAAPQRAKSPRRARTLPRPAKPL